MQQEQRNPPPKRVDLTDIAEPIGLNNNDQMAKNEDENLYKKNADRRSDRFKTALHRCSIGLIYSVSIVGIIAICIRILHMVMPSDCQWLTVTQIQEIDKLFFSGAIGGFIASYMRRMNDN